jgi:hypothetical protein
MDGENARMKGKKGSKMAMNGKCEEGKGMAMQ